MMLKSWKVIERLDFDIQENSILQYWFNGITIKLSKTGVGALLISRKILMLFLKPILQHFLIYFD